MARILWIIIAIILAIWLIGLLTNVGGGLIHLLLIVVVALVIYNLVAGRRV
jgi:hypothetical protein